MIKEVTLKEYESEKVNCEIKMCAGISSFDLIHYLLSTSTIKCGWL